MHPHFTHTYAPSPLLPAYAHASLHTNAHYTHMHPHFSHFDCAPLTFTPFTVLDSPHQQSTYQSQRERFSLKRKHHSSEEEEAASKKEMLDTCLLEASEEHATEGGNAWPSKSHDNISHTGEVGPSEPCGDGGEHPHNKGFSFSPHVCIHTGT